MNEKLPIEFKEREKERNEFHEKSFSANGSRRRSFCLEGTGAPLPAENTSFLLFIFTNTSPGKGTDRLTDLSCVSRTSIPSSSFGNRGTSMALMQTIVSN